ncbi:glycolate oxidase subunit GlcE [Acidithiobacillus sp. AMEEHan]|uniref:glycolate oxidase subunit GlcE n=1 Tax=Acidithiobacillus sp. AMEEHan TaxID=2994951 RepID=UPI0027E51B68|nr:glycolate oxidase subunit GlcE [Acidithiobacillus sp. AMEEHan]
MDRSDEIQQQVVAAFESRTPLAIRGGGSKDFYGRRPAAATVLELRGHQGILEYEPRELFLRARAGTPLREIETTLAERGQMLAFEPPYFSPHATFGGCVASGLAGPRRPYAGAVRDHVLGVRLLNGRGEDLRFGGKVMKNVAGYDVSRLLVGSLGSLGVLLEITCKVLPLPASTCSVALDLSTGDALEQLATWSLRATPISAAAHDGERLYLRLAGATSRVRNFAASVAGEVLEDETGNRFWEDLREQRLPFFAGDAPLWRLALPAGRPPTPDAFGPAFLDWGGQQRWLRGPLDAQALRAWAAAQGGHATVFRNAQQGVEIFPDFPPALLALQQRLKAAFDPAGILNPGRFKPSL